MSVTCIVPVHNHWKTTAECLASIFKSDIPFPYKVIVIDDLSTDFTAKFLQNLLDMNKYPLTVLQNSANKGYLESTNAALQIVDTEYIVFMNNDVHLDKDCIKNLIEVYKKYPDTGILGATQYNSYWEEMSPLKFFVRGAGATQINHIRVSNIPKDLKDSEIIYVDDVHFACALTSKKVVDKVGPLDPQFGEGNYDQEDYCLRVRESGYQIAVAPKARFIHYGSVSVSDNMAYYSHLLDKNRVLFMKKWGDKLSQNKI